MRAAQQRAEPGRRGFRLGDHGVGAGIRRGAARKASQHRARGVEQPGVRQEARRLGDVAPEEDDQQPRRQAQQPQRAPAEQRHQQVGRARGQQVARRGAHAAQRHQQPAPVRGGHRFGHQREGDGQQAAGGGAHQEAHREVPAEGRHRAADGGADEHQRRQQDRRAAPEHVRQAPPDDGADGGAGERHQRQHAGRLLADAVLLRHARHHEAQRGRLEHVHGQREDQHGHQLPVLGVQRHAVGQVELQRLRRVEAAAQLRDARHQAVGREQHAQRDRRHAGQHRRVHLHADHLPAGVAAHEEHGCVREHAADDGDAAQPEGQRMVQGEVARGGQDGAAGGGGRHPSRSDGRRCRHRSSGSASVSLTSSITT